MPTTLIIVAILFLFQFIYLKSGWYMADASIAIKGYDPVAYFLQGTAIKGNSKFCLDWNKKQWRFSSQKNMDIFKAAPDKYAPQYDGYCAFGCSENHMAVANPLAWTIVNDKLYFNYSMKYKKIWVNDTFNRINAADVYWASIS
jgi:YHS domain-containing protein